MIYNKQLENGVGEKFYLVFDFIKKGINTKNILFIILSFILANQNFLTNDITPFSFVLFGVASVFSVPLILVLISSILGLAVSTISTTIILKLFIFFVLFTLVTALINIEGISRRYSVFIKFICSYMLIEIVFAFVFGELFINIFGMLGNFLAVSTLYFVFVAGIYVIVNIKKGYVYSKEESVAMIAIIALALTIFKDLNLLSFSVFNVAVLALILIYGWKSGAILGSAAGLIVGLCLLGATNISMSYIVALAFSGLLAGLLNKLGKVAVVAGFIFGNLFLSYYASGFSELAMRLSEVLVASLSLLFMPKALEFKLDKLFNKNSTLDFASGNMLDSANDMRARMGAVSEVFDSLSNVVIETTPEEDKETRDVIKKYFHDYTENNCISCDKRRKCLNSDMMIDFVATKLEKNQHVDISMLDMDCELSEKILRDLHEIYSSMKLMRILKQKEKENSVKLSNQYKEVSKILSMMAKNIQNVPVAKSKEQEKLRDELKFYGFLVYEDEFKKVGDFIQYTFVTDILNDIDKQKKQILSIATQILEKNMIVKLILNSSKSERSKIKIVSTPEFCVQTSVISKEKNMEQVTGDSYVLMELEDMKQLCVISDGAGSGKMASKSSNAVITMLEKLLEGGFSEYKAIEIVNSTLKLRGNDSNFSTVDALILDLKTAEAQFIKLRCSTYIYFKRW